MTRGPWHLGCEGSHVADVSGLEVSAPYTVRMHRPDEEERAANARLIASAPELLEALKQMRDLAAAALRVIAPNDRSSDEFLMAVYGLGLEGTGARVDALIARVEGKGSV